MPLPALCILECHFARTRRGINMDAARDLQPCPARESLPPQPSLAPRPQVRGAQEPQSEPCQAAPAGGGGLRPLCPSLRSPHVVHRWGRTRAAVLQPWPAAACADCSCSARRPAFVSGRLPHRQAAPEALFPPRYVTHPAVAPCLAALGDGGLVSALSWLAPWPVICRLPRAGPPASSPRAVPCAAAPGAVRCGWRWRPAQPHARHLCGVWDPWRQGGGAEQCQCLVPAVGKRARV